MSLDEIADVERRKTFMGKLMKRLVPHSAAASDPSFRRSLDAQVTAGLVGVALPLEGRSSPSEDELRGQIRSAIDEYMSHGDVVILAHAASHSLAGRPGVLRVFLTGSPSARSARISATHLISAERADKLVHGGDANRADYLKRFYGIEREGPEHYDLVIDTDNLTVDDALAQIIAAAQAA